MAHVFISYAHEDTDQVEPIVAQLKRHFHVWIDATGIKQGTQWYEAIEENLSQSAAVLVFVSNQSKDRPWVLYEIEKASNHGIPCHPYLIESISDLPEVLRETHFIDGSQHQAAAYEKLMDDLPQQARIQGNTLINRSLIGTKVTFAEVAADLPQDAYLAEFSRFAPVNYRLSLLGLPVALSRYCKTYLVGREDDNLTSPEKIQLCVLMSGRDYRNYKVVVAAANHTLTRPDFPLRMLLVEGPPQSDPSKDAHGYGLDVERPDEWLDAYRAIKHALSIYPSATPQVFFNGPGVLLYPLGADRRDQSDFELFQLKYGTTEYYPVLWRELVFGR